MYPSVAISTNAAAVLSWILSDSGSRVAYPSSVSGIGLTALGTGGRA